jgi:hypothetical protein
VVDLFPGLLELPVYAASIIGRSIQDTAQHRLNSSTVHLPPCTGSMTDGKRDREADATVPVEEEEDVGPPRPPPEDDQPEDRAAADEVVGPDRPKPKKRKVSVFVTGTTMHGRLCCEHTGPCIFVKGSRGESVLLSSGTDHQ